MAKEIVIFDNYDMYSEARKEETRRYMLEDGFYIEGELTDEKVMQQIDFDSEENWSMTMELLGQFMDRKRFILFGTFGSWRGNIPAGQVVEDVSGLSGAWKDCDYIRIADVGGHLFIQCSHHDGTNKYELRELTEAGCKYAENHCRSYERDRRLSEAPYSRLPRCAKIVGIAA